MKSSANDLAAESRVIVDQKESDANEKVDQPEQGKYDVIKISAPTDDVVENWD